MNWFGLIPSTPFSVPYPSASVTPADPVSSLSTTMTSRVLMRQELMRQQARDQERREAQQQASRHAADATPAISMATMLPTSRAAPAQVPVEVLKVSSKVCYPDTGWIWVHTPCLKHHEAKTTGQPLLSINDKLLSALNGSVNNTRFVLFFLDCIVVSICHLS